MNHTKFNLPPNSGPVCSNSGQPVIQPLLEHFHNIPTWGIVVSNCSFILDHCSPPWYASESPQGHVKLQILLRENKLGSIGCD